MINGRYIIDGEEHKNLLTNDATLAVLRYLAKLEPDWSGGFAVGTGSTAATTGDTELEFEVYRGFVSTRAVDESTNEVIIKGVLPTNLNCDIHEVGIYSVANSDILQTGYLICDFDTDVFDITNATAETTQSRVGSAGASTTTTASTTQTHSITGFSENFDGLDFYDLFKLAVYIEDGNTSTIEVRLKNSSGDYFTYTSTPSVTGYYIDSWTKIDMTASGSITWADNINTIDILVTAGSGGNATVVLDGLRVTGAGQDNTSKLISRSVLASPKTKSGVEEMDVEYRVQFTL